MDKAEEALFLKRQQSAETRIVKITFSNVTNHHDTLFGGTALKWMDEVASIASIRFSRQQTVTISLDRINFKQPIPVGTFVELVAKVVKVGRTSMNIQVDVYVEQMDQDLSEKAITGMFTFVAVDAEGKPTPVNWKRSLETKHVGSS